MVFIQNESPRQALLSVKPARPYDWLLWLLLHFVTWIYGKQPPFVQKPDWAWWDSGSRPTKGFGLSVSAPHGTWIMWVTQEDGVHRVRFCCVMYSAPAPCSLVSFSLTPTFQWIFNGDRNKLCKIHSVHYFNLLEYAWFIMCFRGIAKWFRYTYEHSFSDSLNV